MKHLDLFSGIGGFALAASRVWPEHSPTFCEIDPYCRALLRKHWPQAVIHEDIKKLTAERLANDTVSHEYRDGKGQGAEANEVPGINREKVRSGRPVGTTGSHGFDLLTGGFPCQPFSTAGFRRGTEDNRYLWPEMLRIIRLATPRWIVAENVSGLLTWKQGMVFEDVCADMENEGYEVQAFLFPACAVDAPHRRDRVWIVAHSRSAESGRLPDERGREKVPAHRGNGKDAPNASDARLQGRKRKGTLGEGSGTPRPASERAWDENWIQAATRLCRMDDGLPARMDGLEFSKPRHRRERLKALGNAIVPQVAEIIFRAIAHPYAPRP